MRSAKLIAASEPTEMGQTIFQKLLFLRAMVEEGNLGVLTEILSNSEDHAGLAALRMKVANQLEHHMRAVERSQWICDRINERMDKIVASRKDD